MTRITLPTIRGVNHPMNELSEARKYSWAQFAWLMLIFNVLFHGAWIMETLR